MQEEINQKTIAIAIKATKVTARLLRHILRALLRHWNNKRHQKAYVKGKEAVVSHGKKSLKELQAQGHELTNIEITDDNIKSFEHCARKYGVDFSLKKDKTADPPVLCLLQSQRRESHGSGIQGIHRGCDTGKTICATEAPADDQAHSSSARARQAEGQEQE